MNSLEMATNNNEFEVCKSVVPHQPMQIKSQAVVKFSAEQDPVSFNRLKCNTDLNLPPLNWLNLSKSHGIHKSIYQNSGFTSFQIANSFPDCVSGVDVICDAENIKRLLKMPYATNAPISMIVHKIGNTLLLDEFDIQKYLLRNGDGDWDWFRKFFLDHIFSYCNSKQNFCLHDKSRAAIQQKNLLSKFLYYSLKPQISETTTNDNDEIKPKPTLPISGPILPEPNMAHNLPDAPNCHVFNRNVIWTFEDIRMLIGTDMPIFGGPNRPCISLRLRDMSQPINVLTGIDYWLDNLMCNVPEVLMCYHLDGIVQKYEIIKTEDLPYLEDSRFSPQAIRNVAQNILAFLKANATKAGHTYWLLKGRNDEVVKLYDLTTLCGDYNATHHDIGEENNVENPFTVPVAMLLYTVARNMKYKTKNISQKIAANIKNLLYNCLKLLSKEKYPQIVISSHYILSDLFVPAGTDPKDPKFDIKYKKKQRKTLNNENNVADTDDDDDDDTDDDDDDNDYTATAAENSDKVKNVKAEGDDTLTDKNLNQNDLSYIEKMKNLNIKNDSTKVPVQNSNEEFSDIKHEKKDCNKHHTKRTPSPLTSNIEERCKLSLEHISNGMLCLDLFDRNEDEYIKVSEERAKEEERQRVLFEEQNPTMAKPFKPIPLPYESLNAQLNIDDNLNVKNKRHKANVEISVNVNAKPFYNLLPHNQIALNFNTQQFGSWNVHLKLLLLEKACLTYVTLAEYYYDSNVFGSSLRALYMAYRCQFVLTKYVKKISSQISCVLGRAGDCFFQMSQNFDKCKQYINQFYENSTFDDLILKGIKDDLKDEDLTDLINPVHMLKQLLLSGASCYKRALALSDQSNKPVLMELLRRYGNICNELGLKYMQWSQDEYSSRIKPDISAILMRYGLIEKEHNNQKVLMSKLDSEELVTVIKARHWAHMQIRTTSNFVHMAHKAYEYLKLGIEAFTKVGDVTNVAFLHCNMGRYNRFRAYIILPKEKCEGVAKQKKFYNEAFQCYETAKAILKSRDNNPKLWDMIHWELSSAAFSIAEQLQDCSYVEWAIDTVALEKDVMEMLQKALRYCEVENPGSNQVLYAYRTGILHRRIASFHYHQLRTATPDGNGISRHILQLAKQHYEKAANIFDGLRECNEYLPVQLERISLNEFQAEYSVSFFQKIKHTQASLDLILESVVIFENAKALLSTEEPETLSADFEKHMNLFKDRLECTLKTLIKLIISKRHSTRQAEAYKRMYSEALHAKKAVDDKKMPLNERIRQLVRLLKNLSYMHDF